MALPLRLIPDTLRHSTGFSLFLMFFPTRHVFAGLFVALTTCRATAEAPAPVEEEALSPSKRIHQLREEARNLRSRAAEDYRMAEAKCYKRFLVNNCIDDAKSERLTVVLRARRLEAESRRLDLAERVRIAGEKKNKAESRPMEASPPAGDADAQFRTDSRTWVVPRKASDARTRERSTHRNASAARRAEAAQRDRERYEARIRELEEKKKRDADGR